MATLSPQGERVLVASDLSLWATLSTYRLRCGIECTFSAMKTRGLNLEQTHMTQPERLSRLFGLLSLALAWMIRVGQWRAEQQSIPIKKHGRPAWSRASYGRELLSAALRWGKTRSTRTWSCLSLLFPFLNGKNLDLSGTELQGRTRMPLTMARTLNLPEDEVRETCKAMLQDGELTATPVGATFVFRLNVAPQMPLADA